MLRGELGDDYVEWLKREFGIGVKDYCVYWFRKAHEPSSRRSSRARRDELDLAEPCAWGEP